MKNLKTMALTSIIILIVLLGASWLLYYQYHHKNLPEQKTATVSTAAVNTEISQEQVQAIGTLIANQGVSLKSNSNGTITQLNFQSGQLVKQGDILVVLDNRTEKGKLDYSKAQYDLSQVTYQRYATLAKKGSISQEQVDNARTDVNANKALVEEAQGDYDKTIIKAPFSGRLGLRNVSLGTYLNSGEAIVNLQNLDPLFVDFTIPEKYLANLKPGLEVLITPESTDSKSYTGTVHSFETVVDSETGTIAVRSELANPSSTLLPGGYANVTLYLGDKVKINTVPQTAIVYSNTGNYVYLVKDNKAVKQTVELGNQIGQDITITSGLQPGQEVISAGTNKVHNGSLINISHEDN